MPKERQLPLVDPPNDPPHWFASDPEAFRLPIPAEFEYAYIDMGGQLVIEAPFKSACPFSYDVAVASFYPRAVSDGRWRVQIVPRFADRWGIMDRDGNLISDRDFDYIAPFQNEKFTVAKKGTSSCLVDKKGKIVHQLGKLEAVSAGSGRIKVRTQQGDYLLYDYNGDPVSTIRFLALGHFADGLAFAQSGDFASASKGRECELPFVSNLFGFVDTRGTLKIATAFSHAHSFCHGYASVERANKWGLIDTAGNTILPFEYDYLGNYDAESGLLPARQGMLYGFVNLRGEQVIERQFAAANEFSQGLAPATEDGISWGYIDANGHFVIKPQFQLAYPFSNSRALVYCNVSKDGHAEKINLANPLHLVRAGRTARNQCDFEKARALFQEAIDTAPTSIAADQAKAFMRADLPKHPVDPDIALLYREGINLVNSGQMGEGQIKLKQCIERAPDFEMPYGAVCYLMIWHKNLDEAESLLKKILSINPDYGRGHERLLFLYQTKNDTVMAERTLAHLRKLNPYFDKDIGE